MPRVTRAGIIQDLLAICSLLGHQLWCVRIGHGLAVKVVHPARDCSSPEIRVPVPASPLTEPLGVRFQVVRQLVRLTSAFAQPISYKSLFEL